MAQPNQHFDSIGDQVIGKDSSHVIDCAHVTQDRGSDRKPHALRRFTLPRIGADEHRQHQILNKHEIDRRILANGIRRMRTRFEKPVIHVPPIGFGATGRDQCPHGLNAAKIEAARVSVVTTERSTEAQNIGRQHEQSRNVRGFQ